MTTLLLQAVHNTLHRQNTAKGGYYDLIFEKGGAFRTSIPAISEAIALIADVAAVTTQTNKPVSFDSHQCHRIQADRWVATIHCVYGLETHAFWLTQALHNPTIKQSSGLLCIPFTLLSDDEPEENPCPLVLPEWFSLYYMTDSQFQAGACIPLTSHLHIDQMVDGVDLENAPDMAMTRAKDYRLPTTAAVEAVRQYHQQQEPARV
jgi:hypothetical protein